MTLHRYYKKRRKAAFIKRIGFLAGFIFLVAIAIWSFFWIPYFRIKKIDISEYSNKLEVEAVVNQYLASLNNLFLPNNSYWTASPKTISGILQARGFGSVDTNKTFPNTLSVSFPKREPWLIFCLPAEALAKAGQHCSYIDSEGFFSEAAPQFSQSPLPELVASSSEKLKLGDEIILLEKVRFLRAALDKLNNLQAEPAKITILNNKYARIDIKEGWYLLISFATDPQKTLSDLDLLLNQKIKDSRSKLEYIDMRYENKAYYKLKN